MKKILFVSLLILIGFSLFGTELSPTASRMRESLPEIYAAIRARAINEWGDNHQMIVFVINMQAEAFIKVMDYFGPEADIVINALAEWTEGGMKHLNSLDLEADPEALWKQNTDWAMVLFQTELQIEAKGQY